MKTRKNLKGSLSVDKQVPGYIRFSGSRKQSECSISGSQQNRAELLRSSASIQHEEDAQVMSQFLDLLWKDIEEQPSKLVPYTEEMSSRYKSLVSGVQIDE
jgi:hypothetical protein